MISKRQRIIEALVERLRAIKTTNGFSTDAGLYLYWGPVRLGPDDPPIAIAVVPGATEPNPEQTGQKIIMLPVEFHALAKEESPQIGTMENAWQWAEAILRDIKKAVEVDDALGGLAKDFSIGSEAPLPRQEGSTHIGQVVEYRVVYTEQWGDPNK